jgi:hypothetical protein
VKCKAEELESRLHRSPKSIGVVLGIQLYPNIVHVVNNDTVKVNSYRSVLQHFMRLLKIPAMEQA